MTRDTSDTAAPVEGERAPCEVCGEPSLGRTLDDINLCREHGPSHFYARMAARATDTVRSPVDLREKIAEIIWRRVVWKDADDGAECSWADALEIEEDLGALVPCVIDATRGILTLVSGVPPGEQAAAIVEQLRGTFSKACDVAVASFVDGCPPEVVREHMQAAVEADVAEVNRKLAALAGGVPRDEGWRREYERLRDAYSRDVKILAQINTQGRAGRDMAVREMEKSRRALDAHVLGEGEQT